MDAERFDRIAKALATGITRRWALAGPLAGALGGALGRAPVAAKDKVEGCKELCHGLPPGARGPCQRVCVQDECPSTECSRRDGGTVCVNLQTDPSNCGACGLACATGPAGPECRGGVCVS